MAGSDRQAALTRPPSRARRTDEQEHPPTHPGDAVKLELILDAYNRRARLGPMLFVLLPVGLLAVAWIPVGSLTVVASAVPVALVLLVAAVFLAQLGRDQGKRKQADLFMSWGGSPTTQLLRHRGQPNPDELKRLHRRIEAILDTRLPTVEQETTDPGAADARYDAAVARLRQLTRDHAKFPLVFEENVNYGVRRNLWGMKPAGLALSLLAIVGTAAPGAYLFTQGASVPVLRLTVCAVAALVLVVFWAARFTPSWVRVAADAYAEQLLLSIERLEPAKKAESGLVLPEGMK